MSGGGDLGGGSGHGHPMLPPQGQGGAQQRVGEPPGQSCKLYSNWIRRNIKKEILKTLKWVSFQLKFLIQLGWFVRSRLYEGCHFKYLSKWFDKSIISMETFQTRSSFHDGSDRRMTLQCCCEKTKSICSGIMCQLRVLFRWENISISSIHSSSSQHKEIQLD